MIVKIHKSPDGKKVIAVCDSDILGKRFEEKNLQLDLKSDFYNGSEMREDDLLKEIRKCPCCLNAVGKNSVDFCIKNNFADKGNITKIKGIPNAQAIITEG